MDGQGTLYGVVQGNSREILQKFSVEVSGGQGGHWQGWRLLGICSHH